MRARAGPTAAGRSSAAIPRSRRSTGPTSRGCRSRGPTTPVRPGDLQTQPIVVDGILYGYSADAESVRAGRGHRRAGLDLRREAAGPRPESRPDVLAGRCRPRAADSRAGPRIHLCPRRQDRHADRDVRRRGPDRSPREPRPRCADAVGPPDDARRDLSRPDDRRRTRQRRPARLARPHPRLRRPHRARCAGSSTPFRSPASSATRPGRRTRGPTTAAPTTGPAWRSTNDAASCSFRPGRRRRTSTGPTVSATTCSRTRCSRSNAETGKRIWHFQFVKHDIWDRDPPSPPNAGDGAPERPDHRRGGADHQARLRLRLRARDRQAGLPDRVPKVPARATCPAKLAAGTQPIPTRPAPFSRQLLTDDMLTTRTPEAQKWALEEFATFRSGGLFVPLTIGQQTFVFPGFDGGAEWGGPAFDPDTGLSTSTPTTSPWTGALRPTMPARAGRRSTCGTAPRATATTAPARRRRSRRSSASAIARRRRRSRPSSRRARDGCRAFRALQTLAVNAIVQFLRTGEDTPTAAPAITPAYVKYRFTGYRKFLDPDGYPAVAPPWGTLNAINLQHRRVSPGRSRSASIRSWPRRASRTPAPRTMAARS